LRRRSSEMKFYFFPNLREISSTIFGRIPARTLSTMLAISGDSSDDEAESAGLFSAPAATARAEPSLTAAVSSLDAGCFSQRALPFPSPDSRMPLQLAPAAAVVSALSDLLLPAPLPT